MKENGTAIPTNGIKKSVRPLVWKDEANTGLDTIRKIILGKHILETEQRLKKLNQQYELIFQQMETRLNQKEAEYEQRLLRLELDFHGKLEQLKSMLKKELTTVNKQVKQHSEKTTDFGKVLMQLGKEWAIEKSEK